MSRDPSPNSVEDSPGADDNASGLAVLLETAKAAAMAGTPVAFLAANAEEHSLAGSRSFVDHYRATAAFEIRETHVLEMVGFASSKSNSQSVPLRFPVAVPHVADFIGLAANHTSIGTLKNVLRTARLLETAPRVLALRAYFGMERWLPDIYRSDHAPFWEHGIPALLWTDTAEYRNPHYHRATDTPDTLNYEFMAKVALLLQRVLGVGTGPTAAEVLACC